MSEQDKLNKARELYSEFIKSIAEIGVSVSFKPTIVDAGEHTMIISAEPVLRVKNGE